MSINYFITKDNIANPFKNIFGQFLTKGLFYELTTAKDALPVYTLKAKDLEVDGKVYPSLKRLYLELEDLKEYTFANTYLDSWDHWQELCKATWFQEYLLNWRTELELKIQSEVLRSIIDEARIGGKNSYDAKKYLLAKGWIDRSDEPSKRGRPSKAEIARRAAEEVFGSDIEKEALKRLELN